MAKQKIRQILVGGVVKFKYEYTDVIDADEWYAELQAVTIPTGKTEKFNGDDADGNTHEYTRPVFKSYLPDGHTVEDINKPADMTLSDADYQALSLAWAQANPDDVPTSLKSKVSVL